jgi:hypothetical protein
MFLVADFPVAHMFVNAEIPISAASPLSGPGVIARSPLGDVVIGCMAMLWPPEAAADSARGPAQAR